MSSGTHDSPTPPLVVGIGELLWDEFPQGRRPGGAPANVAYHARALGLEAVVCSRVGRDALGDELLHHLEANGLDPRLVQRDPMLPTCIVPVTLDDKGAPKYTIPSEVAWDAIEPAPELGRVLGTARAIVFGTLAQRSPVSRATIWRALEDAQKSDRIYDVNLRPPWVQKDWILRSFELATVIKMNGDEALALARLFGLAFDSPAATARAVLHRFHADWVSITLGADGAVIVTPDETARSPAERIDVVDAVGAGDAFTAGIAYGRASGWPPDAACDLANAMGAAVAARRGSMPEGIEDAYGPILESVRARYGLG